MGPLTTIRSMAWCAMFLCTCQAYAQRSGLGVKGAVQYSTIRSAALTSEYLPGAALGFYMPTWVGNRVEFQPELLVSAQGSKFATNDGAPRELRTIYLQFPLSLKFYVSNVVNFQVGAQGGLLLHALQQQGDNTLDMRDQLQRVDGGVNIGLGADMMSGLDIALRYSSGLTPVFSNDTQFFPRNRLIHASVGYRFIQFRKMVRKRR